MYIAQPIGTVYMFKQHLRIVALPTQNSRCPELSVSIIKFQKDARRVDDPPTDVSYYKLETFIGLNFPTIYHYKSGYGSLCTLDHYSSQALSQPEKVLHKHYASSCYTIALFTSKPVTETIHQV